jgi:hypothetical protein
MNIYEIYIEVKDQEQADRLKAICLKYGLPIWKIEETYKFEIDKENVFRYSKPFESFGVWLEFIEEYPIEITEEQFITLLEDGNK